MSLALIATRAQKGIDAPKVTVEVHLSGGLPAFSIVGLPETAVKESRDRVRSAIINSNFDFPVRKIIVNLAPADLPKEGGRYDLPIALGILAASGQLPIEKLNNFEFAGELALSGKLNSIKGALPLVLAIGEEKGKVILPQHNLNECSLITDAEVFFANNLTEVCNFFLVGKELSKLDQNKIIKKNIQYPDLSDVKGQLQAKRALEIAAAGGHSILFCGTPGSGKTMLASRLPGILPPLTKQQSLEAAKVYSVSDERNNDIFWGARPYRAPHHTASAVALVGGGSKPKPGEVTLAHQGVLFLDELPEFSKKVLEVLREPIEAGSILISRAAERVEFPAKFQFIAAMNPCPCGFYGSENKECRCSAKDIARYQAKISGPMLDRIDIQVQVNPVPQSLLLNPNLKSESSEVVQKRVILARERQIARQNIANVEINENSIEKLCFLNKDCKKLLIEAANKACLSARSLRKITKVARTIADLADSCEIEPDHVSEAIIYKNFNFFSK